MRLPAAALEQPIVRAHDAALEAVKELAEMRGLELKVAALRTRRERERHAMGTEVLHELERAGQRADGRPAEVLLLAARGQVVVDCEGGREAREEGEEVRGSFAFGWGM